MTTITKIATTSSAAAIIFLLHLLGIFGLNVSLADAFGSISNSQRRRCHYHHYWMDKQCPATTRRIASSERPTSSQTGAPFLPLVCRAARSNSNTKVDNNSTNGGGNATTSTETNSKPIQNNKRTRGTKESERLIGIKPTIKAGEDWDIYMEELIKYNQTHGTINVPRLCKEYPHLAKFIKNIRYHQKRLTQGQRDVLDSLGFLWKDVKKVKEQQRWLEMFERLQQYKNEFGNCNVPYLYTDGQKPSLGVWVSNQRQKYKDQILEKGRIDMLKSIGFVWRLREGGGTPDDELWEERFQDLMDFKLQFNHTNVPQIYKENMALGMWVSRQRTMFLVDKLRDNRKQRLEEIGFVWNFDKIRDSSWQQQFANLKLHIEKNGRDAPIGRNDLSYWAADQRLKNEKGSLDKRRKAKLDKIGFNWDPRRPHNKLEDVVRNEQDSSRRRREIS